MYTRTLNLKGPLKNKSLFLFGPRQTGKSTLLRTDFARARTFNLLEADLFREFSSRPETLRQSLTPKDKLVVIDEIQKVPALLDEVHNLIEMDKQRRFILTGSSARKLRRGQANLLAGRVWSYHLHPLTLREVGVSEKSLQRMLNVGGLPSIFDSSHADRDLAEYVGTYLREEIYAEGLTRSFERFNNFLSASGFCNGQIVNFTKVGNDCGVPPRTVIEYFKILEDTLVGFTLDPLRGTTKRKAISSHKFYFFDLGVAGHLLKRKAVERGSESYGPALEHLMFRELKSYQSYRAPDWDLTFWRSQSQFEVDFVIDKRIAIEVKAATRVHAGDEKGLHALSEEFPKIKKILVCHEPRYRKTDTGVFIFPVVEFIKALWRDEWL